MKCIMYHYIQEYNNNLPFFNFLHIDNFKKQLDLFKTRYYIPSKDEFNSFINKKIKLPDNSIILTFDDGLKCHYEYVLPELKKRNMWGLFFINSGVFINNDFLDVHKIHLLLGRYDSKYLFTKLKNFIDKNTYCVDIKIKDELDGILYKNYIEYNNYEINFKKILNFYMIGSYRKNFINNIFTEHFPNNKSYIDNFYLTIEEIRKLYNNDMIIGNHSVNHYNLSSLDYDSQYYEINKGYQFLEINIDKNILKCFCFPYGGTHVYNNDTIKILKLLKTSFSFDNNPIDIIDNDIDNNILKLPRYDCNLLKYGQIFKYPKLDTNYIPKELNFKIKYNKKYSSICVFTSNHPRHLNLIKLLSTIADKVYAIIECTTLFKKRENSLEIYFKHVKKSETKYFGDINFLGNNIEVMNIQYNDVSKINVELLSNALKSEVIVVYGASWIKGELCKILEDKNTINIHAGLSPYYRGSGTTFWPIYDNKPEYVGATIHKLALKLDAGDIIYNVIPILNDTIENIFDFTMYVIKITQETLIEKLKSRELWRIKYFKQNRDLEIRYVKNNEFNENISHEFLNNLPSLEYIKKIKYNKDIYFNPIFK